MLLKKQVQILVFKLDDEGVFDNIGEVNHFSSLIWPDKFNGYSQFELWAPITDENAEYFQDGHILWCGGDNAAVVEIINSETDDKGTKSFNIKGRTLEKFLVDRIVWGTYNAVNKFASTVMYEIVNQNCINPVDGKRKIKFLENAPDLEFGGKITYQKTGGEVYDALSTIANNADIGFSIIFRPHERKMIFQVVQGADRTVDQSVNDPVEFSSDLENIITSAYYMNGQDLKTVSLVFGEGEGVNRLREVAGDSDSFGFGRREMSVDARDLQSDSSDGEGGNVVLTPEEYAEVLIQRGNEKLSEHKVVESFEAQIRTSESTQYEYGIDYQMGDKVTIRDDILNVMVSARITEVEESFGSEYSLNFTFGYSYPTIFQKIKQSF